MKNQYVEREYDVQKNKSSSGVPVMAYVPWHSYENMYEPRVALKQGTAFPSLNKPFSGRGRK